MDMSTPVAPDRRRCLVALFAGAVAAALPPLRAGAETADDADRVAHLEKTIDNHDTRIENIEYDLIISRWTGIGAIVTAIVAISGLIIQHIRYKNNSNVRHFENNYENYVNGALEEVSSAIDQMVSIATYITDGENLEEFQRLSNTEWPKAHERLSEKLKGLDRSADDYNANWANIIDNYVDGIGNSINIIIDEPKNAIKVADSIKNIRNTAGRMSEDVKTAMKAHKDSLESLWNWRKIWRRG